MFSHRCGAVRANKADPADTVLYCLPRLYITADRLTMHSANALSSSQEWVSFYRTRWYFDWFYIYYYSFADASQALGVQGTNFVQTAVWFCIPWAELLQRTWHSCLRKPDSGQLQKLFCGLQ
jgi:hypothetical protein